MAHHGALGMVVVSLDAVVVFFVAIIVSAISTAVSTAAAASTSRSPSSLCHRREGFVDLPQLPVQQLLSPERHQRRTSVRSRAFPGKRKFIFDLLFQQGHILLTKIFKSCLK